MRWFVTSFSAVTKSWRAVAKEIAKEREIANKADPHLYFFRLLQAHTYFKCFQSFRTQRVYLRAPARARLPLNSRTRMRVRVVSCTQTKP